jgi:hypothetical protein
MNSIHEFIQEKAAAVNQDSEFEIHGKIAWRHRMLRSLHWVEKLTILAIIWIT